MTQTRSDVVMFMSADVAGSTAFKAASAEDSRLWLDAFATLFRELPLVFIGELAMAFHDVDEIPEAGCWKVLGDEMIFIAMPADPDQAARVAAAFVRTVRSHDARLSAHWPLRIRGSCWAAEIGERNREIDIPEMFGGRDGKPYRDFLGPDVDTGFRLSAHAGHGEVIVSPNLAEAIAAAQAAAPARLRFHHFGNASLKGVIGGQPFPLIMLSTDDAADSASARDETPAADLLHALAALRGRLQAMAISGFAPPAFATHRQA